MTHKALRPDASASGAKRGSMRARVRRACLILVDCTCFLTVAPTRGASAASTVSVHQARQHARERALAAGPLVYHNGPVQRNPVSFLIFWGASWNSGSGLTADGQIARSYFQNVS